MEVTKLNEHDVINFTNTTTEEFVGQWGGVSEVFKAGETKPLPRFKAVHFAKHLAKKILLDKPGQPFGDEKLRETFISKMLGQVATEVAVSTNTAIPAEPAFEELPVEEKVEEKIIEPELEIEEELVEKKKRGRPKKV